MYCVVRQADGSSKDGVCRNYIQLNWGSECRLLAASGNIGLKPSPAIMPDPDVQAINLKELIDQAVKDAPSEKLVALALTSTHHLLNSSEFASLSHDMQKLMVSKLPEVVRLSIEADPSVSDNLKCVDSSSLVRLLVYRYRSFYLTSQFCETPTVICYSVAKASGCTRYRFESSMSECRDPANYESLSRLIQATNSADTIDPCDTAYLPSILGFGKISEKDMDEQEPIGLAFVDGDSCAYIDFENCFFSDLVTSTQRLLEICKDRESLMSTLARQDEEEIDDIIDELSEALDSGESHVLFEASAVSEALDIDSDGGWRWKDYIKGNCTANIVYCLLNHLEELGSAYAEEFCDQDYDMLDSDYQFHSLINHDAGSESKFTWSIEDISIE